MKNKETHIKHKKSNNNTYFKKKTIINATNNNIYLKIIKGLSQI